MDFSLWFCVFVRNKDMGDGEERGVSFQKIGSGWCGLDGEASLRNGKGKSSEIW